MRESSFNENESEQSFIVFKCSSTRSSNHKTGFHCSYAFLAISKLHLPRFHNFYLYGTVSDTARRLCSLQRIRHPLQPFPTRPPFNNGLLSYLSQREKWVSLRTVPFHFKNLKYDQQPLEVLKLFQIPNESSLEAEEVAAELAVLKLASSSRLSKSVDLPVMMIGGRY